MIEDCDLPDTPSPTTDYNSDKRYMDLPRRPNSLKKRETFDSSSLRRPSEVSNTALTKNRSFQECDKSNTRRRLSESPGNQEKRLVVVDSTYINISSVGDNLTTVKPVAQPKKAVKNGPSGGGSRERSSESESSGSITFFYTTDHNSLKPYDSSLDASLPQDLSAMNLRSCNNNCDDSALLTPSASQQAVSSLSLASSASEEFCTATEPDGNASSSSPRHKSRDKKKGKTKEHHRHAHGDSPKEKDRHRHHHHKDKNKKPKHRKHHKHESIGDENEKQLDEFAKGITSFHEPVSANIADANTTISLNSDGMTSSKAVTSALHSSDDNKSIDCMESV